MDTTILYALISLCLAGLVLFLEKDRITSISTPDPKKIIVILIILFFLGTALASLFS